MPKSWKEATLAALMITVAATLLSFVLLQTEKTGVAETLRTSGFVDEPLPADDQDSLAGEEAVNEETVVDLESSLIGMIGITIRQTLQIVIPMLITLRVLKSTRRSPGRKQVSTA